MENPLKIRRLAANYTQDQLADRAGVTHDNIVRNEQGLFNNPSPAVLGTIVELSGDDSERIVLEYHNWIAWKRRQPQVRTLVLRQISFQRSYELKQHPFLLWRTAIFPGLSRIAFCQMLCLHPATVLKYEKAEQRPMPSQIYNALLETGMKKDRVETLAQLGSEYFVHAKRRAATQINS